MKILLELLTDACQLLAGVNAMQDLREDSGRQLKSLLEELQGHSSRILNASPGESRADARAARRGARREERPMAGHESFLQRALELIAREQFTEAASLLEEALASYPEDEEFLSYLGLVAWEMGDYARAEGYYSRATRELWEDTAQVRDLGQVSATALRALEGKALCLYRLQRYGEAEHLFEWLAASGRPEFLGCRYLAGECRHLRGDMDGAIAAYNSVPAEPAVLYNLALACFQRDELERSARHFVQAFVSNVHIANFLLGRYAWQRGCMPGYLGSEAYAEDFVEACARLWQQAPEAFGFMQRCLDHPLVQSHLFSCAERGGENLVAMPGGLSEQEGWQAQLHDPSTLHSLARRILQRLDA